MKLSISLNPAAAPAADLIAAAVAAEESGFDGVYCYDHISGVALGGGPSQHVWAVLGAIAAATKRVAIGPLVANVTVRPAVDIAVAAATLQDLGGGRLVLGLGAGSSGPNVYTAEMDMFGLRTEPAPQRRARVAETIGFLRALWRGDVQFDGEWAGFREVCDVGIPRPLCAIVVGANGPRMAQLAGRHADGVNFHSFETDLAGLSAVARKAAADAGRVRFAVTVEAPWQSRWLDPEGRQHELLADLGIDELILGWRPAVGVSAIGTHLSSRQRG